MALNQSESQPHKKLHQKSVMALGRAWHRVLVVIMVQLEPVASGNEDAIVIYRSVVHLWP